jgi:hypothetical protein
MENREEFLKFFNPEVIKTIEDFDNYAAAQSSQYLQNAPFPHAVIKNLFNPSYLKDVVSEVENYKDFEYEKKFYGSEKKRGATDVWNMGAKSRELLFFLNSPPFLKFLEDLTGIKGLVSDPYLFGGGIHSTGRGGFLKMHTDFNWHQKLKLDRRANVLIYLNEDWPTEWGGDLHISDPKYKNVKKVSPQFNTLVIFSTTDFSFHGHPDPLLCPEEKRRKSLALYFYSSGRPRGEVYRGKNNETNYRERPDENFGRSKVKEAFRGVYNRVPERVKDLYRSMKQ